jgi:phage gp16-like protein
VILQSQLMAKKRTNFMFIKDVTRYQRSQLYKLLEPMGFTRNELFRHYSY